MIVGNLLSNRLLDAKTYGELMLTLNDQKKRLAALLNRHKNIVWQENKGHRYKVGKPSITKGSLWLRITKGNETVAVSSSGDVTSKFEAIIRKQIGTPSNKEGSHRDWFDVSFENATKIVNQFNEIS